MATWHHQLGSAFTYSHASNDRCSLFFEIDQADAHVFLIMITRVTDSAIQQGKLASGEGPLTQLLNLHLIASVRFITILIAVAILAFGNLERLQIDIVVRADVRVANDVQLE